MPTPSQDHPSVGAKSVDPASSAPRRRAVVLLSGGLDSAVVLAAAQREGFDVYTLSFDYGQRHRHELAAASRVAERAGAREHRVLRLDLRAVGGSALTDDAIDVPKDKGAPPTADAAAIPVTYVPARNLVFLSLALGFAEARGAHDLFIGVNAVDYSGYPDCRPAFIEAFERTANLATRDGVSGTPFRVRTPLIDLSKAQIIRLGHELGVDFALTHSCYDPVGESGRACGLCDSCRIRRDGFASAGVNDPTQYA
jgi:7-cyano-7-deazaguanine synthase